jgi:hypothetical protein
MCLEGLAMPHFPMYDIVSADTTGPQSSNLTLICLEQLVVKADFVANNGFSEDTRRSM